MAHDPDNVAGDLKDGCTGVINDKDLVVKGFANSDPAKPLHLRCGKREWEKEVRQRVGIRFVVVLNLSGFVLIFKS